MTHVLNVPQDDYRIIVQSGGTITFDTGNVTGDVVFTGNITVNGTQTVVSSEQLNIDDNIIRLNNGETGNGVTLNQSGIEIERGVAPYNMRFLWDETLTWTDPITETLQTGAFTFVNDAGSLIGIRTNSITTGGGDLYVINTGNGVISVTGTNNYEANVTDDDDIPNKKYVDDEISGALTSTFQRRIEEGTTSKSFVEVRDTELTGVASVINFGLDAVNVGRIYADRFEIQDVKIQDNLIETTTSDTDLILSAPGSGGIVCDDNLTLTRTPAIDDAATDPAAPVDGIKLYSKQPETGGTGLFFSTSNSITGEVISRNNALLLSMLF